MDFSEFKVIEKTCVKKTCKVRKSKFIQLDSNGNLFCYTCHNYKDPNGFDINGKNHYRLYKDRRCKDCKKEAAIRKRKTNRGKKDLNRILLERFLGAKDRARVKNLEFTISLEYLKELYLNQNGKCALSGLDMTYIFANGRVPTNISIDRKDRKYGYTIDNIQLVCMAVNQMKSDLSKNELLKFCYAIIENISKNN